MKHQKFKHRNLSAEMHLKVFQMYKNGANYREIGSKLNIPEKNVENYLLAYVKMHGIDTGQLEKDRDELKKLQSSLNKNSYFNPTNNTNFTGSNSLAIDQLEPVSQTWLSKTKTIICHIFCFWK